MNHKAFSFLPANRPGRFDRAAGAGADAVRLDGELVGKPIIDRARALLAHARQETA